MFIENFLGFEILKDLDGFFTRPVNNIVFGYCDTLEEIKNDIRDEQHDWEDRVRIIPDDTPSLDDSFHRHEMDI